LELVQIKRFVGLTGEEEKICLATVQATGCVNRERCFGELHHSPNLLFSPETFRCSREWRGTSLTANTGGLQAENLGRFSGSDLTQL